MFHYYKTFSTEMNESMVSESDNQQSEQWLMGNIMVFLCHCLFISYPQCCDILIKDFRLRDGDTFFQAEGNIHEIVNSF